MGVVRIIGIVLALAGAALASFPGVLGGETPETTFEAVERRIPWGVVLGLGLALIARTELRPWSLTIATVLFYVTFGVLLTRVLGLQLDGNDSKQWMWVAVEAGVAGLFAAWMWRASA